MKKSSTALRTPLGRVRGLGSAKAGTEHWWMMRVTSLALIALTIYPLVMLYVEARFGTYATLVEWARSPLSGTGIILFLGFGFHHTAHGLQTVIEDYVHCETTKTFSILAVKGLSLALFALGSLATLKIMFGA
jgi:succinate dehydrogenase / fumarate reductase membrane anchor subunit